MALLIVLCELLGGACLVPRAEIEHAVEQYIQDRYRGSTSDVHVEFRSVPEGVAVRGRDFTLRVPESAIPTLSGNVSLPVEVFLQGRVDRQFIVSVKVRTFDTVLVAVRQLGRHENLTVQEARRLRMETTDLKGIPLMRNDQLAGLRTTRIINAGSVLTNDLAQPVPDVLQGSAVRIVVKGRNFKLSLDGVARGDGVIGQQVMVQRMGSTARVQATVLDSKTVEMQVQ